MVGVHAHLISGRWGCHSLVAELWEDPQPAELLVLRPLCSGDMPTGQRGGRRAGRGRRRQGRLSRRSPIRTRVSGQVQRRPEDVARGAYYFISFDLPVGIYV